MVALRAVRASSDVAYRASLAPVPCALTRNILIAGFALGGITFGSAGLALYGSDSFASPVPYIASRTAIKLALTDSIAPVMRRDPHAPIDVPETRTTIAMRTMPQAITLASAPPAQREPVRAAVKSDKAKIKHDPRLSANPPLPGPVPLPLARLKPKDDYAPEETLPLSYAADPAITGSIGDVAPRAIKIVSIVPPKPVLAKPSRPLTPHQKLYGPVRLASLTPAFTMRDATSSLPTAPYDLRTAVYVIGDRKVYMPDGSSLEAHSGLGEKMDDARFVHLRMRGATPPHVYELKMRESLFHGVEAIRLTPIGGEDAIFGRDGLLAHTYLLGPNGQSNGCVSFKDYSAFLSAFKAEKITRLAVIAQLD